MRELALFAGAGGGILGGHLLGWRCVCAVEIDDYARRVLLARQRDGMLPHFPIWDDVTTFDGGPWRGRVDVVSGGFPCQDISAAGKGAGLGGSRSGLWAEFARIIGEVQPRYVFVENSPVLTSRGLGVVLGDLATLGYDARWGVIGACDVGAPHKRERMWIVADSEGKSSRGLPLGASAAHAGLAVGGKDVAYADGGCGDVVGAGRDSVVPGGEAVSYADDGRCERFPVCGSGKSESAICAQRITGVGDYDSGARNNWWVVEPAVGRVAHGVASRVDRLRCLGNGQVPAVAARAFRQLTVDS